MLNGLILKIKQKDFKDFYEREKIYKLKKIKAITYPRDLYKKEKDVFVLINENENEILEKITPNYLYYKGCRMGALYISNQFLEDFDKNTYIQDGKTLATDYIIDNYFKINTEIKVINIIHTIFRFQQMYDNFDLYKISKFLNTKCIVKKINYTKKLVNVEINGINQWFDILDLSPIDDENLLFLN